MKYDTNEEKDKLSKTNLELIKFMKDYPKKSIFLTAIGNSISNGFSMSEPGRALLDRNLGLIDIAKTNGIEIETNQLSKNANNNALAVANWIRNNCTEKDSYEWNKNDYRKLIKDGNPLLNEQQIEDYFSNGKNNKIQDVIFKDNPYLANIVILNLGTGSFLDVVTRHGSLTIPNIVYSLERDVRGISEILEMIQNNNRENYSHTQVYLCGAPRVLNTLITDLAMNPALKSISKEYANCTYIPSFPRQAFYKISDGSIVPDPHYNQAEYFHLLNDIEKGIISSYQAKELMIDMDNVLFKLSKDNDTKGTNYNVNDALDVIDLMAKKYEDKTGKYNFFLDLVKVYIRKRYPFDYYSLSSSNNFADNIDCLKKRK